MKKFLCVTLCFCMLLGGGALSIHANVEQPPISIIEEDAVEEIMEFVSVDNMTGEVKYETLSYTPEVKIMTNGSIGNIHQGYVPESVMAIESEGGITTRDIIGVDSRSKVTNTRNFPYSAICCFDYEYIDSKGKLVQSGGTAWMIGPNIAVTSAHCVYDRASGNHKNITAFWAGKKGEGNGWFNSHNPFGTTTVSHYKYPERYETSSAVKYDWAVLILADEDLGYDTGWFSYGFRQSYPINQAFTITGYPEEDEANDIEEYYMYTAGGIVCSWDADEYGTTYYHTVDTSGGQSGSPMYDASYVVYGIHKGNADKYDDAAPNFAVRITLEIYTCLERIGEIGDISDEVYP